jgi:hypothetical protein
MTDGRLRWEATERNKDPILAVLRDELPASGTVLEIASGTGQHAAHFSAALTHLAWQPTEPDAALRESIEAWRRSMDDDRFRPPMDLDVRAAPWPVETTPCDPPVSAIVNINMIHISPWAACEALMAGAGRLLPRGGVLFLYGPFKVEGRYRTANDPAFDESLRTRNAAWGIRDLADVETLAGANDLRLRRTVDMPAGNLSAVFERT